MDGEKTWNTIITSLREKSIEIATIPSNRRTPVWISAFEENGKLYVDKSTIHSPASKLSKRLRINKEDFLTVYSYYHRWASGERYLRQEVRETSRATAYIFALISYFE